MDKSLAGMWGIVIGILTYFLVGWIIPLQMPFSMVLIILTPTLALHVGWFISVFAGLLVGYTAYHYLKEK